MLRCASSFVIAAYTKVRLIPQDLRALPADILRSRPIFATFKIFYEFIILEALPPPIRQCVFFLTHPLPAGRTHFTLCPSRPPEPAGPFRGRREEKKPRLSIHDPIVYIGLIPRVRWPFRRRIGSKRSSNPVGGMVIASTKRSLPGCACAGGGRLGLDIVPG